MKIILPKYKLEISEPVIFLAGPIKAAPLWQDRAIEIISKLDNKVLTASPSVKVRPYFIKNQLTSNECYPYQTTWERVYLERASRKGCVLFWLPNQDKEMPVDSISGFHKPYARDTRGELGEWRGRMIYDNFNLVIGGEDYFPGLDVIKRNFLAVKPDFKFCNSLEETCREAVNISLKN